MKVLVFTLLLFPVICFAQNKQQAQQVKPPTDACPTWDKKSTKTSKAEYFQFLRSNKAKDKTTYAANPDGTSYSITRTTSVEPRTERGRRNKVNSSSTVSKKEENRIKAASNEEMKEEESEEVTQVKVEETVAVKETVVVNQEAAEDKTEIVSKKKEAHHAKPEKDSPSLNTEKVKQDTKVAGRKVKRFFTRKNKGGKGKAAKCPDF